MTLLSYLLFSLLAIVLAEGLGRRLSNRFRARASLWLLTALTCITFAIGTFLVSSGQDRYDFFLKLLGWPLLALSVPMTAMVIDMSMNLRPRAWLAVVLLVLSLLSIVIYAAQ